MIPSYHRYQPKTEPSKRLSGHDAAVLAAENHRIEQAKLPRRKCTGRQSLPRIEPSPDRLKRCTKCYEWLPIGCFHRRQKSPDFHATECRLCKKIRTITR